jgi:hypothetical protein
MVSLRILVPELSTFLADGGWLHRRKVLKRNVNVELFLYSKQVFSLLICHRVVEVINVTRLYDLILCEINLDGLIRPILRPVIVLFILNELQKEKHMTEINKTVPLVGFLINLLVLRQLKAIESALMIFLEVLSHLVNLISTRDIFHHQSGPNLLSSFDFLNVDWTSIVCTERGDLTFHTFL